MKTLRLRIAQLGESQGIDKIDDFGQGFLDPRLCRARGGESENSALPEILITALGHRDIELVSHSTLNAFQHAPLALQRVVLRNRELEFKDSHDHRQTLSG